MYRPSWSCPWSLFICSIVAVVVIVGGQPTTDDDSDKSIIDQLIYTVTKVVAENNMLKTKVAKLEAQVSAKNIDNKERNGATYIRWGRKTCDGNATVLYRGYAAGPPSTQSGNGANYLCLPEDPQWKSYIDESHSGSIAGVEYEFSNSGPLRNNIFSERNNGGNPLLDNPAPCAVCYVEGHSTILMIPARTQCPDGWSTEYAGYLVSSHHIHKRVTYICMDEAPEIAVGGINQNQARVYPVEVRCGSLPCSLYPTGREMACIVCSK